MIKAVFVDFYGTLVRENGPIVGEVLADICAAGEEKDPAPALPQPYFLNWRSKALPLFPAKPRMRNPPLFRPE